MTGKTLTTLAGGLIGAAILLSAHAEAVAAPDKVTVLGGSARGSWYPIAVGIGKILKDAGTRGSARIGGGNANVVSVSTGQAEAGITFNFTAAMAAKGEAPFKSKITNLRAISGLFDNFMHLVVTQDSGIKTVPGMKGKRFSMQSETASTTTMFRIILRAYGMTPEKDLNIVFRGSQKKGAEAMMDRRADGLSTSTIWPTGVVTELAVSRPIKLIDIDDAGYKKIQAINPGLKRYTLPAGTYKGQDKPVKGVGSMTALIVNESMSDADAYWITKVLADNIKDVQGLHKGMRSMTVKSMAQVEGIPMHPGAARYYKEMGLLK
jgi:TRAP transporter TAXI family solute receptor